MRARRGRHPMDDTATDLRELDGLFETVAGYFTVLGEPMRLKILHVLCVHEHSVGEIVAALDASQANVSRHLNLMHHAGVLSRRKQGNQVYYAVKDDKVVPLCRAVLGHLASAPAAGARRPLVRRFMKRQRPRA